MREETKKLKGIVQEAMAKADWVEPTVLGAMKKKCECDPGPYAVITSPSYGIVCDNSGYIKECNDC